MQILRLIVWRKNVYQETLAFYSLSVFTRSESPRAHSLLNRGGQLDFCIPQVNKGQGLLIHEYRNWVPRKRPPLRKRICSHLQIDLCAKLLAHLLKYAYIQRQIK